MGLNQFMGCEDRQTTGHLPYDGLFRSDDRFYIHQPSVSGIVCRAGAPSPSDGFARRNGLSRYPMRGFVRADTMVGIVPMHGFVRAQPQWFVDAGSRCMVYTNPPSMPPHGN